MCAATRLSFVSVVCEPVTSILLMVALNVIAVCAELKRKRAVPNEAGLAPPVVKVGVAGGTSWLFVRLTTKSLVSAGDSPAVASKLSTYCALVRLLGYLATNSGRVT